MHLCDTAVGAHCGPRADLKDREARGEDLGAKFFDPPTLEVYQRFVLDGLSPNRVKMQDVMAGIRVVTARMMAEGGLLRGSEVRDTKWGFCRLKIYKSPADLADASRQDMFTIVFIATHSKTSDGCSFVTLQFAQNRNWERCPVDWLSILYYVTSTMIGS